MAITAIKKITKIKSTEDLRIIAAKKEKKEAKEDCQKVDANLLYLIGRKLNKK